MALGVAELASWHCGWGMGEYEEKKEKEENDDCPLREHGNEDGRENRQVVVKFERQVPGEKLHVKHHYLSFTWSQVTPVVQEKGCARLWFGAFQLGFCSSSIFSTHPLPHLNQKEEGSQRYGSVSQSVLAMPPTFITRLNLTMAIWCINVTGAFPIR